jgi:hypothetical protein
MTIGGGMPNLGIMEDGGTGLYNPAADNLHAIRNAIVPALGEIWPVASVYLPQIVLVNAPFNRALPNITIAGIPAGAVVTRALALITFRSVYNTNVAINSVSGVQTIQCQNTTTGGPWTTVFSFVGGELSTDPASYSGGDVLIGQNDFSAQIAANGDVIAFQWTQALAVVPNFNINDIQIIIRLWVG